jgi:TetR/AcrR family transcriptional regulator
LASAEIESVERTSKAGARVDGEKSDASTRDLILNTALEAFAQQGFDGASTRSIANQAGVNQGLIPYYFGSKEALWREAVDRAFDRLDEAMGYLETRQGESLTGQIDKDSAAMTIRRYVDFVAAHPEFVCLMNEEGKRAGPRMEWLAERHVRPWLKTLETLLSRVGQSSDRVSHVKPIHFTYIFLGAVSLFFHQAHECRHATGYDPMTPAATQAHADALVELFLGDARLGTGKL